MSITIIVPVFNEEEALPIFYREIYPLMQGVGHDVELLFINDGSTDATGSILAELAAKDPSVTVINFSRNFGKELALMAGIVHADGDAVIPMDIDLQDPVGLIPDMIKEWESGAMVVLPVRVDRTSDSFFKRKWAELFYTLHNLISKPGIVPNAGDFRLLDREVVLALRTLSERQLFMKGVFAWVGFEPVLIPFQRAERSAGTSKFNFWKLWNFAIEGITSFSTVPLRIWSYLGFGIACVSMLFGLSVIIRTLLFGNPVSGYTSLMTVILFLGGINLIGIGILGEYVGRTYIETKQRPRYVIKSILGTTEKGSR